MSDKSCNSYCIQKTLYDNNKKKPPNEKSVLWYCSGVVLENVKN